MSADALALDLVAARLPRGGEDPSPDDELTANERAALAELIALATSRRPRTLVEIGAQLGISRERVRQIEAGALRKMRLALLSRCLSFESFSTDSRVTS